ncbi:MAG TPA: OmpA family protein [Deltaproteobacteria bacterium]|nr:OmpA family protein [Deltaproteobacteria bacterium]
MRPLNVKPIPIKIITLLVIAAFILVSFTSCTSTETQNIPKNQTTKGALYGAAGGAALGAVIGNKNPVRNALIGAAGGALAGGAVGYYMDRQKNDLQTALSHEINAGQAQVQKLPDNAVQVSMTQKTAFPPGSSTINPSFVPTLQKVANVVNTYGKSTVSVIGAPDTPSGAPDQAALANQRAEAVRNELINLGVKPVLITASGNPQATGNTEVVIQPLVAQS